jgi:hypothetical protein
MGELSDTPYLQLGQSIIGELPIEVLQTRAVQKPNYKPPILEDSLSSIF